MYWGSQDVAEKNVSGVTDGPELGDRSKLNSGQSHIEIKI